MAVELPFRQEMNFEYGVPGELTPGVRRVVANNPSAFTFKGTNTYLVGERQVAVIDPGPDDDGHLDAILNAVGPAGQVTHILLTHNHRDHCDGLAKFKARTGAVTYAFDALSTERGDRSSSPSGSDFVTPGFVPDITLGHGEKVDCEEWSLECCHTPGHAPDHLCFALEGADLLFSGDHVMGWNTSVIAPPEGHMGEYMHSLEKLIGRPEKMYCPGHGGTIREPQRIVKAFLMHRRWRERSILNGINEGLETIETLVERFYAGVDERVLPAAGLSVLAHVELLIEKQLVFCDGAPTLSSSFFPVRPASR